MQVCLSKFTVHLLPSEFFGYETERTGHVSPWWGRNGDNECGFSPPFKRTVSHSRGDFGLARDQKHSRPSRSCPPIRALVFAQSEAEGRSSHKTRLWTTLSSSLKIEGNVIQCRPMRRREVGDGGRGGGGDWGCVIPPSIKWRSFARKENREQAVHMQTSGHRVMSRANGNLGPLTCACRFENIQE